MTILNMGSYVKPAEAYGFEIDESVSDPSLMVTYPAEVFGRANGAYGKTPASCTGGVYSFGSWTEEFITGIRRELWNGTTWEPTSSRDDVGGSTGHPVCVYFPSMWMRADKVGTKVTIAFASRQWDSNWHDLPGTDGNGNHQGWFRLAAWPSPIDNRSSGVVGYKGWRPEGTWGWSSEADHIFQKMLSNTGMGNINIEVWNFVHLQYVNLLLMMMFKTTDITKIVGQGRSGTVLDFSSPTYTNDLGFAWSDGTTPCSVFWLYDLYSPKWKTTGSSGAAEYCTGLWFTPSAGKFQASNQSCTYVQSRLTDSSYSSSIPTIFINKGDKFSIFTNKGVDFSNGTGGAYSVFTKIYGKGDYPLVPYESTAITSTVQSPTTGYCSGNTQVEYSSSASADTKTYPFAVNGWGDKVCRTGIIPSFTFNHELVRLCWRS